MDKNQRCMMHENKVEILADIHQAILQVEEDIHKITYNQQIK